MCVSSCGVCSPVRPDVVRVCAESVSHLRALSDGATAGCASRVVVKLGASVCAVFLPVAVVRALIPLFVFSLSLSVEKGPKFKRAVENYETNSPDRDKKAIAVMTMLINVSAAGRGHSC